MARKSVKSQQLESSKTLASNFTTNWVKIPYLDNVGFVINCDSVTDNTGTFAVQVRIKEKEGADANAAASAATTLTLSSTPTLADADDDFFINLNQLPATEVRLSFTAAGGTPDGTCDIFMHSATVGG